MTDLLSRRSAIISKCGLYRRERIHRWSDAPLLPFLMLNPSDADAYIDDPTSRRTDGFARREGAGGTWLENLYDFRTPSPAELWKAEAPHSGLDNERALLKMALQAVADDMPIVCAWGAGARGRGNFAVQMLRTRGVRLVCLGKTKDGSPRHPLYVRADQPFEAFP